MLDVFKGNAYNSVALTTSINKLPYKPNRLGELGLFAPKSITTLTAAIEERQGKLSLLTTAPRGTSSLQQTRPVEKIRAFPVPHIPANDEIKASDVQGVRAFGSEDANATVAQLVNDRLTVLRQNHEVTHEYHRVGAIQGVIKDGDGSTTIYNLFTEFGISETVVTFDFGSDEMKLKVLEVKRALEDALGNSPYTRIRAFCGDTFFDDFITDPTVAGAYERYQENQFARTDVRGGFDFGGIIWENYRGKIGATDFIDDTVCRFVAEGVPDLFQHISAPANFIETVNTPGKPVYAKQEIQKMDMGVDLHSQSNPLIICTRPATLIKGVIG